MTRLELAHQLTVCAEREHPDPEGVYLLLLLAAEIVRQADEEIVDLTCELREAYDR